MNISERELHDFLIDDEALEKKIYEYSENDVELMNIYSEVDISPFGRADIITAHTIYNEQMEETMVIDVFELKITGLKEEHIHQVYRYCYGIFQYAKEIDETGRVLIRPKIIYNGEAGDSNYDKNILRSLYYSEYSDGNIAISGLRTHGYEIFLGSGIGFIPDMPYLRRFEKNANTVNNISAIMLGRDING